jgi:hypothetical protein
MMLKLYRRRQDGHDYWEAWDADGKVTIHWGQLGETGETRTIPTTFFRSAKKIIETESKLPRTEGYREIEIDDHYQVVVQYQLGSNWGTDDDLKTRHEIESIFNECFGWTGNGMCDGGDIGSGMMNIFSYVVDPTIALRTMRNELSSRGLLDSAIIAVREGDEYRVVWPENFSGDFFGYLMNFSATKQ